MRLIILLFVALTLASSWANAAPDDRHLLYVAVPGIRNEAKYGGTGILVFDIDHGHKFVRRIAVPALGDDSHPDAAKGICACAATGRVYVSTPKSLTCLDLTTDKVIWSKTYDSGCDRMSISPDGKTIYEPTFEGKYWHVIDAEDGRELSKISIGSGAHNTVVSLDGRHVYLAGLHSPNLGIADAKTFAVDRSAGPFAAEIRPFTVNGRGTLCYVCINKLLGFEIGDLQTGAKLARVEVKGFESGPTLRHGCPSHGIALTPDETEVWVCDAHNSRLHVFDNTVMPPRQKGDVALHDQPGWITFGIDGHHAYPSTGEVIDTASRKIVTVLKDDQGREVQSEKLLEIDFAGDRPSHNGDQFGLGRIDHPATP